MKRFLNWIYREWELIFILAVVLGCVVGLCSGCADRTSTLSTRTHEQAQAARDSELTRQNVLPPITASVNGTNNTINLNVPPAKTTSTLKAEDSAQVEDWLSQLKKVSLPSGVKLLLVAAGLLALWLAVWLWRRSSGAVDEAYQAADAGMAKVVGIVEDKMRHATEPGTIAHLSSVQTVLEKERGKLSA